MAKETPPKAVAAKSTTATNESFLCPVAEAIVDIKGASNACKTRFKVVCWSVVAINVLFIAWKVSTA